jgi:hypothetical protein
LGDSRPFQEALKRGSVHAWGGRWEQAVQEYRLALNQSPRDPSARTYLAMALFKSGQLREALGLYQDLCKAQPSNLSLLLRLAEVQEAIGDCESALANYRLLATTHEGLNQPKDAVRGWRKAVALNPADLQLWDALLTAAERAGSLAEQMPGYLRLAREMAMGARFQDAIQVVERAQQLDPSNPAVPELLLAIRRALEFSWRAAAAGESVPEEALVRWFTQTSLDSEPQRAAEPVAEQRVEPVADAIGDEVVIEDPDGIDPAPAPSECTGADAALAVVGDENDVGDEPRRYMIDPGQDVVTSSQGVGDLGLDPVAPGQDPVDPGLDVVDLGPDVRDPGLDMVAPGLDVVHPERDGGDLGLDVASPLVGDGYPSAVECVEAEAFDAEPEAEAVVAEAQPEEPEPEPTPEPEPEPEPDAVVTEPEQPEQPGLEEPEPELQPEVAPPTVEALLMLAAEARAEGRLDDAEERFGAVLDDNVTGDADAARTAAFSLLEIARERAADGDLSAAAQSLLLLRSTVAQPQLPPSLSERAAAVSTELFGCCCGEHLEEIVALPLGSLDGVTRELKSAEELASQGLLRSAADAVYKVIAERPDFLPAQSLLGRIEAAQGLRDMALSRSERLTLLYDIRGSSHQGMELRWWQVAEGVAGEDARTQLVSDLRAQNRLLECGAVRAGHRPEPWSAGWARRASDMASLPGPLEDLLRRAEAAHARGDAEETMRLLRSGLEDGELLDPPIAAALLRTLQVSGDVQFQRQRLRAVLEEMGLPQGLADW